MLVACLTAIAVAVPVDALNDGDPGGAFYDDDRTTHEQSIDAIAAAGITRGCNPPLNDRFCPNRTVTRAEAAAFLRRALGLVATGGDWFGDDDGSIFEGDIDAIAAAGITRGCNPPLNDRFCPNRTVTRAEMATLLARGFDLATPIVPSRTKTWSNSNAVEELAFDAEGNLWAVGPGGAVLWNVATGAAVHYTVDDGLAANEVHSVAVAPDGSVWFGTDSGVSRLDNGHWTTWRSFGLPPLYGQPRLPYVGSIAVAPNGDVWAGLSQAWAVARFDGTAWTAFTETDGLGPGWVTDVAVGPAGTVYATTESLCCEMERHGGLSVYDGGGWHLYESFDAVRDDLYSIAVAGDGSVWLGGCSGVHHFDGREFTSFEVDAERCLGFDITVADGGEVLLATPMDGIGMFDGVDWVFSLPPRGWFNATSVAERDGVVWAGGWRDLWRVEDDTWTALVRPNQPPLYPTDAATDRNGVLWVVVFGEGAYSFNGNEWAFHEHIAGSDADILRVAETAPNGDLWLGPYQYDGITWTNHIAGVESDGFGAPTNVIDIAFGDGGSVWMAGEYAVYCLCDGLWKTYGGFPLGAVVTSVAVGAGNVAWVVTTEGIYRHNDDSWDHLTEVAGRPVTDFGVAANGPDGRVWVNVQDAFAVTDGAAWIVVTPPEAISTRFLWTMAVDGEGRLWVPHSEGPGQGLSVYDRIGWTRITTANGLASDYPQAISIDPNDTIWITSANAITRYVR
jgi:ligand-binding sensor domain-containing protein